jgi:hypothetical protein
MAIDQILTRLRVRRLEELASYGGIEMSKIKISTKGAKVIRPFLAHNVHNNTVHNSLNGFDKTYKPEDCMDSDFDEVRFDRSR